MHLTPSPSPPDAKSLMTLLGTYLQRPASSQIPMAVRTRMIQTGNNEQMFFPSLWCCQHTSRELVKIFGIGYFSSSDGASFGSSHGFD